MAKVEKEHIVAKLQEFGKANQRAPKRSDISTLGFGRTTVYRHFGTWNNAIEAAGLSRLRSAFRPKIELICKQCRVDFVRAVSSLKNSENYFCSQSCGAIYNNSHKSHGTRRSKLEVWLELELIKAYPELDFVFNQKDAINSELDIYIPSLKAAFELNGIFHYEPVYGSEKLGQIQNNDRRKFAACIEEKISLCIIDTSALKYFKPDRAKKYLDVIVQVIEQCRGNGRI